MRDLQPSLFQYIWRHSRRDQLTICAVVILSLPFYFASLDLPRRIVNDAITGKAFEKGNATTPFLDLTIPWPHWLGGGVTHLFAGFQVDRAELLFGLSIVFLGLVLINGAFKFWINLTKGVLGERMLRRLRFDLFALMLRFTPEAKREVKASETATIIRDEVEPIGSFIGDAIVVPVFLGTQAATALSFILMQNLWLGLAAGAIVGVQIVVIPRLRREIIRLSRQRQLASRAFAGRVGEVLEGLDAVTVNNASRWERAEIGGRLYNLYDLRLRIYRRKFAVKYLNNLLAQVTPFLFYAIGGMFALRGQLDIGQLVAVLAAYRDLPPPLKELIDWDQQRLDVEVKYETVAAHFGSHRLSRPEPEVLEELPRLGTPLRVENLSLTDPHSGHSTDLNDIALALPARVAIVSPGTDFAHQLVRMIAGLQTPQVGSIRIGDQDMIAMSTSARARRISYSGPNPILFPGSIRDNLIYGLHADPQARQQDEARWLFEALRTGNPVETVDSNWIDYQALGAADAEAFDAHILALLSRLGMDDDLYRLGLTTLSRVSHDTPVGARMIAARESLRRLFAEGGTEGLVIPFARGRYNEEATIAENLLFGVPRDPRFMDRLASEPRFRTVLFELDLLRPLSALGVAIARNLAEIFRDVPAGHPLFRRFSLITPEDLPDYTRRLAGVGADGHLSTEDCKAFLALALHYVEPRQRLGLLDDVFRTRIVGARGRIQEALQGPDGHEIESHDPGRINPRSSVLDNLLFGRIDTERVHGEAEIRKQVLATAKAFDLESGIRRRGLDFCVGNRGQFLAAEQRAKIDLARAILRRPEILVVEDLMIHTGDDAADMIDLIADAMNGGSILASLNDGTLAAKFELALQIGFDGSQDVIAH